MMLFARWATALISAAGQALRRWQLPPVRTLYLSPTPPERLGRSGAAAIKRHSRKLRNRRRHRHGRA